MNPIEEFTDDQLIKELSGRYDHFIYAGRKDNTKQDIVNRRYWHGDYEVCTGLAQGISIDCLQRRWGVNAEDIKE